MQTRAKKPTVQEKRKSPRHKYDCRQLVAPCDGIRMPSQDEFNWALFRDISASGLCFLSDAKPTTELLVVAIGTAPFSFLLARVARCIRRNDLPGEPYEIGCRLVRELTADDSTT